MDIDQESTMAMEESSNTVRSSVKEFEGIAIEVAVGIEDAIWLKHCC
jgi:hypothetical protein